MTREEILEEFNKRFGYDDSQKDLASLQDYFVEDFIDFLSQKLDAYALTMVGEDMPWKDDDAMVVTGYNQRGREIRDRIKKGV